MTPRRPLCASAARALTALVLVVLAGGFAAIPLAHAQNSATARVAEEGVRWQDLSSEHRTVLRPLEKDWASIAPAPKQKWVEIAVRFPTMPADERGRIQARMAEWAQMTPRERGQARLNFQEAKQASPQDRRAQWEAYQALPDERKRQLAARAVPPPPTSVSRQPGMGVPQSNRLAGRSDEAPPAKSNIVPNPAHAQPLRQVAPTVVQAQPGATTTFITKRPVPPPHQQTGLPKIAATPEFVDRATLLPQRGPQGAATRSAAAASDAQSSQRR